MDAAVPGYTETALDHFRDGDAGSAMTRIREEAERPRLVGVVRVRAIAAAGVGGVELALHKDENPVVATVVVPALVAEEEEAAPAVAAAEVPTTEQAAAPKEGEGEAADKGAAAKAAEKPAAEKKEKK